MVRVSRDEMRRPIIAQMGATEVKEVLTQTANYYHLRKAVGEEGKWETAKCRSTPLRKSERQPWP